MNTGSEYRPTIEMTGITGETTIMDLAINIGAWESAILVNHGIHQLKDAIGVPVRDLLKAGLSIHGVNALEFFLAQAQEAERQISIPTDHNLVVSPEGTRVLLDALMETAKGRGIAAAIAHTLQPTREVPIATFKRAA